jgi:hypothetical protein
VSVVTGRGIRYARGDEPTQHSRRDPRRRRGIGLSRQLAVAVVIPALIAASGLWASVAAGMREPVSIEGVLTAAHGDDFEHGRAVGRTHLLTDAGRHVTQINFHGKLPQKFLGRDVHVSGHWQGGTLVADAGSVQAASGATTSSTSYSTGTHRVAVVLFNFSNDTSQPYTPAFAQGVAFSNTNSVAAYYAINSWNQLTLTGNVYGWVTIPDTNASCAYSTWANHAASAASGLGFNAADYDNVVYAFPQTSCGWAGLASMPGSMSWLNGPMAMSLRVMAHELGHNFGTHHAGEYKCTENGVPVPLSANTANCTTGEYGDPFSVMGSATQYEHTDFARGNFNWLVPANVETVTATGDYDLAPVEFQSSTAVTALRVARTSSQSFTLEFRQADGSPFDTFSPTSAVANGILIRLTATSLSSRTQSWLVWAHPSSTAWCACYAPLKAGESLTDPLSGVTFSVKSVSSTGAVVNVSFSGGGATPSPSPTPTPALSPTPSPTPSPPPTPSPSASPTPTPTVGPTPSPYLTAPGSLVASMSRSGRVSLTWTASTGNVAVAGYRVYRDGALVTTTTRTRWADRLVLAAGASRTYYIVAYAAAGATSPPSNQATVP